MPGTSHAGSVPGNLCIRADASLRIGAGHVMRCLALAHAWRELGGGATFLGSPESALLRERILQEGFQWVAVPGSHPETIDLEATIPALAAGCTSQGKWVVLDGYHFDEAYQLAVREAGHSLLLIDDTGHLPRYHADILLNQSTPPGRVRYRTDPGTRLLMGHRYAMLRDEFLAWAGLERHHPIEAEKILVTLGGADPDNVTRTVVEALEALGLHKLSVRVVIGASSPHRAGLEALVSSVSFECRLLEATGRIPEWMAWADMAVSGGGTTCWEMAFMGLPNLVVVIAENQQVVADTLHRAGCSEILNGSADVPGLKRALKGLIFDPERRHQMSRRGRSLIDGRGGRRVARELLSSEWEWEWKGEVQ